DGRDHFGYAAVSPGSPNYPNQTWLDGKPTVIRDDTKRATTHANQLRSANEFPPLAGSVSIPFLTTFYQIGDRISPPTGRGISLQTNIGESAGEAPGYPWIVGISHSFEPDRQGTVLQLSDRRGEGGMRNAW